MKKIFAAAVLSAASLSAIAADQGAYLAADLGSASYSNAQSQLGATKFGNPGAISIGGGYHFNANIGVEAGYSRLGDSTITTVAGAATATETLKTTALQIAAVGTFPIGEKFSLFGKLGMANTKVDYTATVTGGTFVTSVVTAASAQKTNLTFALGGQYNFNQHFGIRAQYQDFGKANLRVGAGNWTTVGAGQDIGVKVISVGGVYNF